MGRWVGGMRGGRGVLGVAPPQLQSPDWKAMITSWMRSRASSLVSRWATWVLAVAGLIVSRSAISALDRPRATIARTSCSRSVS